MNCLTTSSISQPYYGVAPDNSISSDKSCDDLIRYLQFFNIRTENDITVEQFLARYPALVTELYELPDVLTSHIPECTSAKLELREFPEEGIEELHVNIFIQQGTYDAIYPKLRTLRREWLATRTVPGSDLLHLTVTEYS